jgi:hypothetical protein
MTATDLETASLAIAGRLSQGSSLDSTVRAQLALGLLQNTPGQLRAFIATLRQTRAERAVPAAVARARRTDAVRLLRGTGKLRGQLTRIVKRQRSFAR